MATKTASTPAKYAAGQRLQCVQCGAEVEIVSPCTCKEGHQVLQCCGRDMVPTTGRDVHLGVE